MNAPPTYPRIAHLVAGRGTSDDRVMAAADVEDLLGSEVAVEEKLDGANVVVWPAGGRIEASLRSGPGGADRAGQLGPLRAWIGGHLDSLSQVLQPDPGRSSDGLVLYAEWLYLSHSLAYDRLPSLLFALDLRRPDGSFVELDERDRLCAGAGLAVPPELWRGRPGVSDAIEALFGTSHFADEPMEGVVVRRVGPGEPRIAKLLRPGWTALDDSAWARGRPHNRLAEGATAWR